MQYEGKHVIRTQVFKGSTPPYHLKNKSREEGTFIRVGSTNRLASPEMIAELERQKQNRSFDSELVYSKAMEQIDIETFKNFFLEKTGEELTISALSKLELFRQEQGKNLPTNALILLSDDELRKQQFPYAKIECARSELQPELQPELQQELQQETLYSITLMQLTEKPLNTKEISQKMGQKEISGQLRKILRKLHKDQLIENSIPESPNHPAQKHQLTEPGRTFLKHLTNARNRETTPQ